MDLVIDEEPEHHQHHHRPHHQARGIFMGLVLFNGAVMRNQNTINLFWDESKLQRYIDKWEYFLFHCVSCMSISVPSLWVSLWCTTTQYTVEILCMIVLYPIALIKLLSALTPMVKGLRDHPALAFWEVNIIQQIAVVSCHFT